MKSSFSDNHFHNWLPHRNDRRNVHGHRRGGYGESFVVEVGIDARSVVAAVTLLRRHHLWRFRCIGRRTSIVLSSVYRRRLWLLTRLFCRLYDQKQSRKRAVAYESLGSILADAVASCYSCFLHPWLAKT